MQNVLASVFFEIEAEAFLVAVDREEIGTLAINERRSPVATIVSFGRLDFEDVSAHIAEHHRAIGPGEECVKNRRR